MLDLNGRPGVVHVWEASFNLFTHKRSWCAETHGNVLTCRRLIVCVFPLLVCVWVWSCDVTHTHMSFVNCTALSPLHNPIRSTRCNYTDLRSQECNIYNILLILGQKKCIKRSNLYGSFAISGSVGPNDK